jgi:hypothetical protein
MTEQTIFQQYQLRHKVSKEQEVGIEVEMEGRGLDIPYDLIPNWQLDGDGSLRGHSVEYKLNQPVKRKEIYSVLKQLKDAGIKASSQFKPSLRCGVHIHINCQEMTEDQVENFICLYLILEGPLTRWCGKDREGNLFCLRSSDAEALIEQLVECRKRGGLWDIMNDHYRYSSINPVSLRRFGSLEFRSMATPKNLIRIKKWALMLLKLKDKSLQFQSPREMVEHFSGRGGRIFLREIMDEFFDDLVCPETEDMLTEAVRRVQYIAYTEKYKRKKVRKKTTSHSWADIPLQDPGVPPVRNDEGQVVLGGWQPFRGDQVVDVAVERDAVEEEETEF